MGLWEWTITPYPRYSDYSYNIVSDGNVEVDYVNTSEYGTSRYPLAIRPCFYLNKNVTYVQGDGSKNTPFIIT